MAIGHSTSSSMVVVYLHTFDNTLSKIVRIMVQTAFLADDDADPCKNKYRRL